MAKTRNRARSRLERVVQRHEVRRPLGQRLDRRADLLPCLLALLGIEPRLFTATRGVSSPLITLAPGQEANIATTAASLCRAAPGSHKHQSNRTWAPPVRLEQGKSDREGAFLAKSASGSFISQATGGTRCFTRAGGRRAMAGDAGKRRPREAPWQGSLETARERNFGPCGARKGRITLLFSFPAGGCAGSRG